MSDIDDYRQQLQADVAAAQTNPVQNQWSAALVQAGGTALLGEPQGDSTDTDRLTTVVRDQSAAVALRAAALDELVRRTDDLETEHVVPLAVLADETETAELRRAALQALKASAIHDPTSADWRPDYLDALRAAITADDTELRLAAFEVLTALGDRASQERLIDGLENPDQALVSPRDALRLLADDPHSRARDSATALLQDPDDGVRIEAMRLLAGDAASSSTFRSLLLDQGEGFEVRKLAATALANLSPDALRGASSELEAGRSGFGIAPDEPDEVTDHIATILAYLD